MSRLNRDVDQMFLTIIGDDLAKNLFQRNGPVADGVVCPLEDAACTTGLIKINYLRARDGVDAALSPTASQCAKLVVLKSQVKQEGIHEGN